MLQHKQPGKPKRQEAPRRDRQRLDKWLWFARVVKTRTLACRLVEAGHVRVNGERCTTPARALGPDDVLTVALERQVRVLRIVATGERRGPFEEARLLFQDLEPDAARPMLALQA